MKKALLIIIMAIIALLGGCATISEEQRQEWVAECASEQACVAKKEVAFLEQREYERQAKREAERDKIRAYILACKQSSGHTMVYDGPSTVRRPRRGEVFIPRHARIHDYHCMRNADLRDWMRQNMGASPF